MNIRNKFRVYPPPAGKSKLFPQFIFLISVILSIGTTYYVTGNILDSDASSELVLAKHLAETGQILSQDWIYSTELRVLNTQLVYAPLFLIFEDWHMVRFCGAIILQSIYILSYAFLLHKVGLSRQTFFLSAALLLLPVSVTYGRIVLYHTYYIPHIALSFLLLGLVIGLTKQTSWKKFSYWLSLLSLLVFSFLGGLGGIRQLMITHAPMVISVVVFSLLETSQTEENQRSFILPLDRIPLLLYSVFSALVSFLGLKVNTGLFSKLYIFENQSENILSFLDGTSVDEVLYGFFHQFGFRLNLPMISLGGILSIGAIFVGTYCIIISIQKIHSYHKNDNIFVAILQSFFFFYSAIMIAVFILTGGASGYHFPLYLVLCLPWAVPLLVLEALSPKKAKWDISKMFVLLSILILLFNGFANVSFFCGSTTFTQTYEGLSFKETGKKQTLSDVTEFLSTNDYDIGYATFWESNIITEITNGQIRMINVEYEPSNGNLWYYNWLTSQYLREEHSQKPFLLLPISGKETFESSDSSQYCSLVFENDYNCIFDITDSSAFISTLYS